MENLIIIPGAYSTVTDKETALTLGDFVIFDDNNKKVTIADLDASNATRQHTIIHGSYSGNYNYDFISTNLQSVTYTDYKALVKAKYTMTVSGISASDIAVGKPYGVIVTRKNVADYEKRTQESTVINARQGDTVATILQRIADAFNNNTQGFVKATAAATNIVFESKLDEVIDIQVTPNYNLYGFTTVATTTAPVYPSGTPKTLLDMYYRCISGKGITATHYETGTDELHPVVAYDKGIIAGTPQWYMVNLYYDYSPMQERNAGYNRPQKILHLAFKTEELAKSVFDAYTRVKEGITKAAPVTP